MDRIGRFQILGELGRGAMAVVYRALDPAIGRAVAIKTFRLADIGAAEERTRQRERIAREARAAGALAHPGIVTIYDILEEGDTAHVVMECVDGPTLESLMGRGPVPKETIYDVLGQTAAALDYAHRKGIVHRDVKPANIMIGADGVVKITDFGVAKMMSQQFTQTGAVIGTPNYMSPEQIRGGQVSGRSDQFALAVVAYELLTGEKPFEGDSMASVVFKVVQEDPAPPSRLNPTLSPDVDSALMQALAKKPEERHSTCAAFVTALLAALERGPDWKPLPRGAGSTMPTLAAAPPPASPEPAIYKGRHHRDDEPEPKAPVKKRGGIGKTIVATLLGFFLVGGLFFGLEYFLGPESTYQKGTAPNPDPPQHPDQANAPRPSPAGDTAKAVEPPKTDEPKPAEEPKVEAPKPEARKAEAQKPEPAPPPVRSPSSSAEKTVTVETEPRGAFIVLDNNPSISCKSPCTLPLLTGRHSLKASLDGYRTVLRIFEVPQTLFVFAQLEKNAGKVGVNTVPPGASIYVDGQARPEKTPAILNLSPGRHRIAVQLAGYSREEEEIEVRSDSIKNFSIDWGKR